MTIYVVEDYEAGIERAYESFNDAREASFEIMMRWLDRERKLEAEATAAKGHGDTPVYFPPPMSYNGICEMLKNWATTGCVEDLVYIHSVELVPAKEEW